MYTITLQFFKQQQIYNKLPSTHKITDLSSYTLNGSSLLRHMIENVPNVCDRRVDERDCASYQKNMVLGL